MQGYIKVSLRSDAPLTDEQLAELAFQGEQLPLPLGYVRLPVADLPGLERRYGLFDKNAKQAQHTNGKMEVRSDIFLFILTKRR